MVAGGRREAPSRVLVIDDNLDCANGIRLLLETEGYQADVACGGEHGLDRARELVPDIVLCDIEMPVLDGVALARALRADPALVRATLIAVTGHSQHDKITRALAAGFDAHLTKPIFVEDLVALLGSLR